MWGKNSMKNYCKVIILAFLIIGMVAISACVGSSSSSPSSSKVTTIATADVPAVQIVSKEQGYKSYGDVYVSGIVKNNRNKELTAWLNVDLYDKNDVKLGTGYDIVTIDPYGQSKFEVLVFGSDKYTDEFDTYRTYIDHVY